MELVPTGGTSPNGRSPGDVQGEVGALAVTGRRTKPFSLLGATWADPRAPLDGTIEVRTRSVADGRWTGWQALEVDGRSPADPGGVDGAGRGRTDPLWVGTSDAVQARVTADGRTHRLPAGLRLDLINPDQPESRTRSAPQPKTDSAQQTEAGAVQAQARIAVPARPVPRMTTRAGWGADESIVKNAPEYSTDVRVMFVHHTAGTNDYNCRDSARIVRGIAAYHVRSNKWNDIGYNFLVDKCGTLFEGRRGGVNRAVLGAHTLGFNAHSSAIAVLGNYVAGGVPARARTVIAQVAAYKLGGYGYPPGGRVRMLSSGSDRFPKGQVATLNRISGHRDTGRTECPGDALYRQLGSIRSVAGGGPAGLRLLRMYGATAVGPAYYTRGLISPLWTTTTPSALLDRFDVFVDGKLKLSATNSHRRGALRLPPGRHEIRVRALHMSGRSASFTRTVIVDQTAPRFTMGPAVVLRTGAINGAVPVRLGWTAVDTVGLRTVSMTRPAVVNLSVRARSRAGFAKPNMATTWALRAADRAGNTRNASVTRTPVILSDTSAARTGRWATVRNSAYLGRTALRSSTRKSGMSWTFTGRSASLVVSRTAISGRATVYFDGRAAGTLDLRATSTRNRQVIWAKNWGVSGKHTVRVVIMGTPGRPGVVLDGLTVLR